MVPYYISGIIFTLTFIAIFSEKIHRTIAATIGAVLMVIAGIVFNFYSEEKAIHSIDFNTLALLFGMMVLVALLKKTGFFQYLAIITAQKSRGDSWKLLVILGTVTTVVSCFLDNVTTIILIAPVTVLIAEILGILPLPILLAEALLSNTGGVATLVGDPPNILIGSAAKLSFNDFIIHLAPIVFVAWLITLYMIKFIFRKQLAKKPKKIEELMRLNASESITDKKSLIKVLIVLSIVIMLFFTHHALHISPSLVATIGMALGLLLIRPNIEEILKEVEWPVLLFFAALFVAVGGVESSGLLDLLAGKIMAFASKDLLLSCIILIWVSAFFSAIVDNIPFTIAMIPVIQHLEASGIMVAPLWWALALGVGFGGNGTPIGSTAGIIAISISEKTRSPITFKIWLKSGFPVMIATCLAATLLFFVAFEFMK